MTEPDPAWTMLDAAPITIVRLDREARITHVNEAWRRFARANGADAETREGVGLDYLAAARQAGDERVAVGLSELVAGRAAAFSCVYPCHSSTEARWFRLEARRIAAEDAIVVAHTNITGEHVAEARLRVQTVVAKAIAGRAPLLDTCSRIMRTTCEELEWDFAATWMPDEGEHLVCVDTWARHGDETAAFETTTRTATLALGRGLPGSVWADRSPRWIESLAGDPEFRRAGEATAAGLRTGMAVPLVAEDQVFAVVELFSRIQRARDPALLELLATSGAQLGAEVLRERAEQRAAQLLEAAPDAMVIVDSVAGQPGQIAIVNDQTLSLFGYRRDELIGQPIELLLPERFREAHPGHRAGYFRDPKRRPMGPGIDQLARRKDGTEFPAEISLAPTSSPRGTRVIAAIRDVTERKRTEAAIAAGQARYQTLLDNMLEAVQILGFDWRYLYLNDAAARNGQQLKEEMLGKTVMERYPGFETTEMYASLRRCMEERTARTAEFEFTYPDRTSAWFEFSIQPVPEGLFVLSLDITARKRVDQELRALNADLERRVQARTAQLEEANQFLNAIIENIPNMVFVKEPERLTFVRFNKAGEDLLGVAREDVLGKTDYDLVPAAQAELRQAKDRETLRRKVVLDIAEESIDTTRGPRWLYTKKIPILDAAGTPQFLLGISEDITERREADHARVRLAAIVESSDDAIIGRSLDGVVTSWNQGAERIFGYSAEEIVGKALPPQILGGRDAESALLAKRVAAGERIAHFVAPRWRKDGQAIYVSANVSPIRDAEGRLIGSATIARDITEAMQIQDALARAKDAAEVANRELESFSYSVAHDLRAPLRSIDGFSQALLEDYVDKLDAEGKQYLAFIRESAQHMALLIDDMLALSRVARSELHRVPVDLEALARAAIVRLQRIQPERRVDVVIEKGLVAEGDPRLLTVVLDNLLGNAWKFTGKREDARIELGATAKDGHPVYFVRDNGAGFDMAFANKLFGVFQRLHTTAEFEGTGVGLATVHRVISRHGGRVWAEGAVDRGATFYFTLYERERAP